MYGPLFHAGSRIDLPAAADLARIVAARGGVLVHLTGDPGIIEARLRARDGTGPAPGRIRAVTDAYHAAFTLLDGTAPVITADTTTPRPGDV